MVATDTGDADFICRPVLRGRQKNGGEGWCSTAGGDGLDHLFLTDFEVVPALASRLQFFQDGQGARVSQLPQGPDCAVPLFQAQLIIFGHLHEGQHRVPRFQLLGLGNSLFLLMPDEQRGSRDKDQQARQGPQEQPFPATLQERFHRRPPLLRQQSKIGLSHSLFCLVIILTQGT
jgi:hypothetical protein